MSTILPFGEWSPDLPDFNNSGITVARNVVPLTPQSYAPLPSLVPFIKDTLTQQTEYTVPAVLFTGTASEVHYSDGSSTTITQEPGDLGGTLDTFLLAF